MVQNKTAWKHGAARAVKAIFAVLGALTIVFFAFFGGEFSTLKTLNRVEDDANLFTMEYKADYALDRFLENRRFYGYRADRIYCQAGA